MNLKSQAEHKARLLGHDLAPWYHDGLGGHVGEMTYCRRCGHLIAIQNTEKINPSAPYMFGRAALEDCKRR